MPDWVPDSRVAGYLGPRLEPRPMLGDVWEDFLHEMIAGITGLPSDLVRPLWQTEPPARPDLSKDWCAFGVTGIEVDPNPWVWHDENADGGLGCDMLQEHQVDTIQVSFFGPNCHQYASFLRRGIFIWQNRAVLRANNAGLVEMTSINRSAELIHNQWVDRVDTDLVIRREIRYNYNDRTLLRAQAEIAAKPPFESDRTLNRDVDTAYSPTTWANPVDSEVIKP